tara:strand:+ start:314 stop:643 length:330 start_codon:yes stop_codon:yes gene_type:complete
MKAKVKNFLKAITSLSESESDIGEMIVVSYIERLWASKEFDEVHVSDILSSINNYSSSSINRKLKQLKKKKVLLFEVSSIDERLKIIKKGLNYNDYIEKIEALYKINNH